MALPPNDRDATSLRLSLSDLIMLHTLCRGALVLGAVHLENLSVGQGYNPENVERPGPAVEWLVQRGQELEASRKSAGQPPDHVMEDAIYKLLASVLPRLY